MKKKCPLRGLWLTGDMHECVEEECAWWRPYYHSCSMAVIGK